MTTSLAARRDERQVQIPADGVALSGTLAWPAHPGGVVLFAHGSGSSRLSPRNQYVARHLRGAGLATVLFDLLTEQEAAERANVFDIPLLAARLLSGVRWAVAQPELAKLPIGLFGASTGAAAALIAAATAPESVAAVVSRGGRPDLAGEHLPQVRAATLLLVGAHDEGVLALNRQALARLTCPKRLDVIPGAAHLFEEPGALENVAERAAGWFGACLGVESSRRAGPR